MLEQRNNSLLRHKDQRWWILNEDSRFIMLFRINSWFRHNIWHAHAKRGNSWLWSTYCLLPARTAMTRTFFATEMSCSGAPMGAEILDIMMSCLGFCHNNGIRCPQSGTAGCQASRLFLSLDWWIHLALLRRFKKYIYIYLMSDVDVNGLYSMKSEILCLMTMHRLLEFQQ